MPCSSQITYPNRYHTPQSVIHSSLVESPGARPRVDSHPRLLPPTFTHLPKLGTDLVTTLSRLNVNDFSASRSHKSPLPVSHPHRNQSHQTPTLTFPQPKKARAFVSLTFPLARPPAHTTALIRHRANHPASSSRTSSFIPRSFLVSSFACRVESSVVCIRPSHSVDLSPKIGIFSIFSSMMQKKRPRENATPLLIRVDRTDGRTERRSERARSGLGTCPRVSFLYPRASCPVCGVVVGIVIVKQ